MDTIQLTGVRAFGHHGVFAHERADGQWFVADISLEVDLSAAGASDDLSDTVHYGEVAQAVVDEIAGEPCQLIEALAARIAGRILAEHPRVAAVAVTVHKPQAPIPVEFADVSVTISRSRA